MNFASDVWNTSIYTKECKNRSIIPYLMFLILRNNGIKVLISGPSFQSLQIFIPNIPHIYSSIFKQYSQLGKQSPYPWIELFQIFIRNILAILTYVIGWTKNLYEKSRIKTSHLKYEFELIELNLSNRSWLVFPCNYEVH